MKRSLLGNIPDFRLRIIQGLLIAAIFTVMGYYAPRVYHRYLDNYTYIEFTGVNFNKKDFTHCETVVSAANLRVDYDMEFVLHSRFVKIEGDKLIPVRESSSTTFHAKTPKEGVVYTIPFKLPCDRPNFTPGVYYIDGEVHYKLDGISKYSSFRSPLFTVTP